MRIEIETREFPPVTLQLTPAGGDLYEVSETSVGDPDEHGIGEVRRLPGAQGWKAVLGNNVVRVHAEPAHAVALAFGDLIGVRYQRANIYKGS